MNSKYTPLRYEITTVETLRYMPDDANEIAELKQELTQKYEADVTIEKYEYEEREWSWRTDSHYTVNRTEYRVKCLQPVYSEADLKSMHKEAIAEAARQFQERYAPYFKNNKR